MSRLAEAGWRLAANEVSGGKRVEESSERETGAGGGALWGSRCLLAFYFFTTKKNPDLFSGSQFRG